MTEDPWLKQDPWSKMKGAPAQQQTTRQVQAPAATALSGQDAKLQKMQEQLDGFANKLQTHEQRTMREVNQLRGEIKDSRTHFKSTLNGALQKQSEDMPCNPSWHRRAPPARSRKIPLKTDLEQGVVDQIGFILFIIRCWCKHGNGWQRCLGSGLLRG